MVFPGLSFSQKSPISALAAAPDAAGSSVSKNVVQKHLCI